MSITVGIAIGTAIVTALTGAGYGIHEGCQATDDCGNKEPKNNQYNRDKYIISNISKTSIFNLDNIEKIEKDKEQSNFPYKNYSTTPETLECEIVKCNMDNVDKLLKESKFGVMAVTFRNNINDTAYSAKDVINQFIADFKKKFPNEKEEAGLAALELYLWTNDFSLRAKIDEKSDTSATANPGTWGKYSRCGYNEKVYEKLDNGALYDPRVGAIAMMNAMEGEGTFETTVNRIAYSEDSSPAYRLAVRKCFNDSFGKQTGQNLSDWIDGDYSGSEETKLKQRFSILNADEYDDFILSLK